MKPLTTKRKKTKKTNLKQLKDLNTEKNPRGGGMRVSGLWTNHNEIFLADLK